MVRGITRIIVGGNYSQALAHHRRTISRYAEDRPIVVGHTAQNLRGWHNLFTVDVEFVGAWRERTDLDEIVTALGWAGVDPERLWLSLIDGGMAMNRADSLIGYSVRASALRSLQEIVASLAPPSPA